MRAAGLRRLPKKIQKKTLVSKEVLRGSVQRSSREVLNNQVAQAGPQEVAKEDVAKGRFERRSREEVVKGCREKRS